MSQSQWSGVALTGYGSSRGLGGQCKIQLAAERPLFTHASIIFFGPELGPYQHSLAPRRSILEHVSICSPSQFVHLHGKPYRLFFERELDENAPISVRVIATSGITHGRKIVSPLRNPYDSDPFLVATYNRCSPSWDPHRFFFSGSKLERNRIWETSLAFFLYLPPSIGLLLTVRSRFFCTRDRV